MHAVRWCLLSFTAVCWAAAAFGQELALRRLSEENGLPSDCVFDLHLDHQGLLWVATNKGLYRYDGFSFEHIAQGTALDRSFVIGMLEGPKPGEFFFACTGKHLFHFADGAVSEWVNDAASFAPSDGGAYTNMCFTATGHLLLSTTDGTRLYRVEMESRHFDDVTEELGDREEVRVGWIDGQPMGVASKHRRAADQRTGTVIIDLPTFKGTRVVTLLGQLPVGISARRLSTGELLAHWQGTMWKFGSDGRLTERSFAGPILGVMEDRTGDLWVRVFGHGVCRLNTQLEEDAPVRWPFPTDHLTDAVQDDQGGIWFSTLSRGLYYAANPDLWHFPSESTFNVPYLTALTVDSAGQVYVGSCDGKLFQWNERTGPHLLYAPEGPMKAGEVKSVIRDGSSRIWPGTLDVAYDTKRCAATTSNMHGLINDGAYDVARLSDGRLLMANHNVLRIYRPDASDSIRTVAMGMRFTQLCPTGEADRFWVTTSSGLFSYANERITPVASTDSLLRLRMHGAFLSNDSLWLATERGVVLYANGRAHALRSDRTPWGVCVRDIECSDGRWIWAASLNGLLRFDRCAPLAPPLRVDRTYGLPSNVIYKVAADGERVWCIAGPDLCSFRLNDIHDERRLPALQVLGMRTAEGFVPGAEGHTFERTVDHLSIALRHVFYGRFLGPAFRYRQAGSSEWTTTDGPSIDVVGMKPGAYRLEIQASDGTGGWGRSVLASWTIATPYWRTKWFFALLTFLISLLGSGLIFWLAARKRREIALLSEARYYRHRALLAQMEPHFVFNTLNSIQDFVLRNEGATSARYLARFAKLMRGLLQASDRERVSIADEMEMLDHYCTLEALRHVPPFQFSITVDPGLEVRSTTLPALLLQPYVENAIRHGLRHLDGLRPGRLTIHFGSKASDLLYCVIEDNGVGRTEAERIRARGSGFTSQGTRINAERLQLLELGSGEGHYAVEVEDLLDNAGTACGTRVSVTLGRTSNRRAFPHNMDNNG